MSISGNQTQTKRLQTLLKLRQFQCRILVATDLAARGIDAEHIDLVIHMDVPREPATYLHRVGRGGRFGAAALACTIACEGNELTDLRSIITRTRASVRILSSEHLTVNNQKIADLEVLWPTLPELEGTGLEGTDVDDSLLADIESSSAQYTQKSSTYLLPSSTKRSHKNQPRQKPAKATSQTPVHKREQPNRTLLDTSQRPDQEQQQAVTQHDWSEWYNSWMAYASWSKAYVQQQEYFRLMTGNFN